MLAANVDRVWVVRGLDLDFNPRRLERHLAVVWDSGASPKIILTKSDLADVALGGCAIRDQPYSDSGR